VLSYFLLFLVYSIKNLSYLSLFNSWLLTLSLSSFYIDCEGKIGLTKARTNTVEDSNYFWFNH